MTDELTQQELTVILDYDPETGIFRWKDGAQRGARVQLGKSRAQAGTTRGGKRYIAIHMKDYAAHRLAWFYVNGTWPDGYLIPLDGDWLNLRVKNFAEASPRDMAIRGKQPENLSSGVTGVSWDKRKKKWYAYIRDGYKMRNLGTFSNKDAAIAARMTAEMTRSAPDDMESEEIVTQREVYRVSARYRDLWRRTLKDGATGWEDISHFKDDIVELKDRANLVPINPKAPIGPGNWQWAEPMAAQFDTSTRHGRRCVERAYREANAGTTKAYDLRRSFGIDLAEYQKMFVTQAGVCACCEKPEHEKRSGKTRWLAVDHCHETGEIRGLLCGSCNRGIGKFEDDPNLLRKAADYLERHAEKMKKHGAASNVVRLKTKDR